MAELFLTTKQNVSQHLQNAFEEAELQPYAIVQTDGTRRVSREFEQYNLNAILSVGYRVRSQHGTQFCIWATERAVG